MMRVIEPVNRKEMGYDEDDTAFFIVALTEDGERHRAVVLWPNMQGAINSFFEYMTTGSAVKELRVERASL